MTKEEAKSKLEFLETNEEERVHGLRRIKRRNYVEPGEMALRDCWVETTLSLNPDVLDFFDSNSERINEVLRHEMEKVKIREELLADTEFVNRLREKLAA